MTGATFGVATNTITIFVNAQLIWPLLEPRFTASEKAGYYLVLASLIMHELVVSTATAIKASCHI